MRKSTLCIGVLLLLFVFSYVMMVSADPVYTSVEGSTSVPLNLVGTPISVTAQTTDSNIASVVVTWFNPSSVLTFGPDTVTAHSFISPYYTFVCPSHSPNVVGNWRIQIDFYNAAGALINTDNQQVSIVGPTNYVPEVPIIGTVGALAAMALGLVYVTKRKTPKQEA